MFVLFADKNIGASNRVSGNVWTIMTVDQANEGLPYFDEVNMIFERNVRTERI